MKQIPSNIKVLYDAHLELVVKPLNSDKVTLLKYKDEKLATKKDSLKLTNANWVPVYDGLISEIQLRHYSPKTLKSYRSWIRHFQNYTQSKDSQLISTAAVKDFLTFLAVKEKE